MYLSMFHYICTCILMHFMQKCVLRAVLLCSSVPFVLHCLVLNKHFCFWQFVIAQMHIKAEVLSECSVHISLKWKLVLCLVLSTMSWSCIAAHSLNLITRWMWVLVTILPLYILVDESSYHTLIRKLGGLTAIVKEVAKRNMKPLLELLYSNSE